MKEQGMIGFQFVDRPLNETGGEVFESPVGDVDLVRNALAEVLRIANSIGFALAERGVQFTAADVTHAAQRVLYHERS